MTASSSVRKCEWEPSPFPPPIMATRSVLKKPSLLPLLCATLIGVDVADLARPQRHRHVHSRDLARAVLRAARHERESSSAAGAPTCLPQTRASFDLLTSQTEPRTAFKSDSARANEVTLAKARAIKRRIDAKKIEESSI